MKVLFSTYTLAFQNPGGGEKVMMKTADSLRSLGHAVDIYNPWKHTLTDYDVIHYFSSLETGFWQAAHDQCPQTPFFVTPTLWSTGKTSKYKIKRLMEIFQPSWNRTIAFRSMLPYQWFPTTQIEANFLITNFNISQKKIQVIPNGVDKTFFNPNPEKFRKWSGIQGEFILHVGRFHPVKNQLPLIRAFKAHGIPLVLIGGSDIDHVKYYDQCILEANAPNSNIKILGPLPMDSELIPSAYAAASALVLPSQFETFGLTAFEAIAAKVPKVFVTQNCAAKLDIENLVEWIDPQNLDQLALNVKNFLSINNPIAQDYSQAKIMNWLDIAKIIEEKYSKLLSN